MPDAVLPGRGLGSIELAPILLLHQCSEASLEAFQPAFPKDRRHEQGQEKECQQEEEEVQGSAPIFHPQNHGWKGTPPALLIAVQGIVLPRALHTVSARRVRHPTQFARGTLRGTGGRHLAISTSHTLAAVRVRGRARWTGCAVRGPEGCDGTCRAFPATAQVRWEEAQGTLHAAAAIGIRNHAFWAQVTLLVATGTLVTPQLARGAGLPVPVLLSGVAHLSVSVKSVPWRTLAILAGVTGEGRVAGALPRAGGPGAAEARDVLRSLPLARVRVVVANAPMGASA
mmetsp:Transcript_32688/g.70598  ORF Transcript_32688/g.70598 Transcript_32688/m.70598 type:complete len:285 (-) Transcript_32688:84-938(-)